MSAFELHLPQRSQTSRWVHAAVVTGLVYGAIGAAAVFSPRTPLQPNIIPAISVTLGAIENASPDIPEQAPPEPPKLEQQQPTDQTEPLPAQPSDVTLPKPEPKVVETKEPPPPPATVAPPESEHVGQFSQAGSKAYNSLVFGHLQRFKRYPATARGASGTVEVSFTLNRAGDVVSSSVTKSSGNAALDEEALALLHRASPFPAFPAAKPGSQDLFIAPVSFSR